ncbi:hypothetical protein HDU83_001541, partial [Entophlyctis luteolus]
DEKHVMIEIRQKCTPHTFNVTGVENVVSGNFSAVIPSVPTNQFNPDLQTVAEAAHNIDHGGRIIVENVEINRPDERAVPMSDVTSTYSQQNSMLSNQSSNAVRVEVLLCNPDGTKTLLSRPFWLVTQDAPTLGDFLESIGRGRDGNYRTAVMNDMPISLSFNVWESAQSGTVIYLWEAPQ